MDKLTQDGSKVITTQEFLALFPDIVFPTPIPYADFGWFVVASAPIPAYDPITQGYREIVPVYDTNHWIQRFEVYDLDAETVARNRQSATDANNARIKAEIAVLDLKRIRPLAEGDTVFLANLNSQIAVLRAQLQ